MSAPPGFGGPSSGQPNGESGMEGDFFGTLTQDEINKKARKWRQSQKRRFDMKRRAGGGGGIDMGKAVSVMGKCGGVGSVQAAPVAVAQGVVVCCCVRVVVIRGTIADAIF